MNCASCSAPIQIKPEVTQFVCAYCGSSQIVDRSGGAVTLNLVTDAIHQVQRGTDRTAAELALVRLREKRTILQEKLDSLGWPRVPKRERPADWLALSKLSIWATTSLLMKDPVKYPWYEDGTGCTFFTDKSRGPTIQETVTQWKDYDRLMIFFHNTSPARQAHNEMIELEEEISHNEAIVKHD